MREEYSDRKLFFGMALRPQNKASPWSATSAMTWLLRSIDHSLSASEARSACAAGIMCEPGSLAPRARVLSPSRRTRSGTNRNSPPTLVLNSRLVRTKSWTLATASTLGPTRKGPLLVEPARQWREAFLASTSRTAVALSGVPCSLSARLIS